MREGEGVEQQGESDGGREERVNKEKCERGREGEGPGGCVCEGGRDGWMEGEREGERKEGREGGREGEGGDGWMDGWMEGARERRRKCACA